MAKKKNGVKEEQDEHLDDLEDAMDEAENGDIDPVEELEQELALNAAPEDADLITDEQPDELDNASIAPADVVLVPVKVEINRKSMENWFKWCGHADGVLLHVGKGDVAEIIGMEVSNRMTVRKWMPCKNKGDNDGWLPLTGAHISFAKCLGITSGDEAVLDFDMKTIKITTKKETVNFDVDTAIVKGTYSAKKMLDDKIVSKGKNLIAFDHEYANSITVSNTVLQSVLSRWSKYGTNHLGLQIANGKLIARFVNDIKDALSDNGASIEIDAEITCNDNAVLGFPDISAKALEVITKENGFVTIHFFDSTYPYFVEAFITGKNNEVDDKIQLLIAPLVCVDEEYEDEYEIDE